MATIVTIPLEELDDLRAQIVKQEKRAEQAEKLLSDASRTGPGGEVYKLLEDALDVALFGIGNLPPESVRGWPHATVKRLGEGVNKVPELPLRLREIGPDLVQRAGEMATVEEFRRKRDLGAGVAINLADEK